MVRNNMPPEIARFIVGWKNIQLDGRALLFTLAAAVAAGIIAGLAPAWNCSRPNLTDTLKEGGRGSSCGGKHRLRGLLVASEIALAVVLLVGAGLMVRGFQMTLVAGSRLEPETLLTLRLEITANRYKEPHQIRAFYQAVLERLGALPGVRSTAIVTAIPYSQHSSGRTFTIEGRAAQQGDLPKGMYQVASASYFRTVHVPLREGRFIEESDGTDAPRVALISESLARKWWRDQSPIGKRIRLGGAKATNPNPWLTIVGVVGDMVHDPYDREPRRAFYVPFQQTPMRSMDVGVRTAGDPMHLAPAVTPAIRAVDREQPVTDMMSMQKSLFNRAIGLNYMAWLMGIFGALALALSTIGVYGMMAYLVSEQTHEIGIRMALGASRLGVMGMVFRRGLLRVGIGLAAGLPIAYSFARLLTSLIYGVTATDAASFVGIPVALVAAAALAIYIPARRAMKIDPIVALRHE
jgi:putative ABC transport system permease protein